LKPSSEARFPAQKSHPTVHGAAVAAWHFLRTQFDAARFTGTDRSAALATQGLVADLELAGFGTARETRWQRRRARLNRQVARMTVGNAKMLPGPQGSRRGHGFPRLVGADRGKYSRHDKKAFTSYYEPLDRLESL
jgi:hypothetical protein